MKPTNNAFDTIVIGAGPAGLAVGGCLSLAKVKCLIIEKEATVGPLWSRQYDRLHLHTTRNNSGLPGLPLSKDLPTYVPRSDFIQYLDNYRNHFNLHVQFDETAVKITRQSDLWEVSTDKGSYVAKSVVVATGLNGVAHYPKYSGVEGFGGTIIHSSNFKKGAEYAGQNTLVVGFGNSGAEIALDLAEAGANVALSIRSPTHVVPRDVLGIPVQILAIQTVWIPIRILDPIFGLLIRIVVGSLKRFGIRSPKEGVCETCANSGRVPVLDIGCLKWIKSGKISVHRGIKQFHASDVEFTDKTRKPFQRVIFATGYRANFQTIVDTELDSKGLPKIDQKKGLYFVGFHYPLTGALRQISREAQEVSRMISEQTNFRLNR